MSGSSTVPAGPSVMVSVRRVSTSGEAVCVYPDDNQGAIDWVRWTAAGGWVLAFAASDTTEYDFPEEEGKNKHLIRDIAIWVIVAGMVGFFIIEVFIRGDTDDESTEKPPGKPLPTVSSK